MKFIIKQGRVVDPATGLDQVADVVIEQGKLVAILPNVNPGDYPESRVFEAKGKIVVPGLVDMHVHLREPGFERKETIATGTRAAARGGFTAIACMPNTSPVVDNRGIVEFIQVQAQKQGVVNVYPIGAITKGSKGIELTEMADLAAGGAVAFSDDGRPVMNAQVMRLALEYAQIGDWLIIDHCEDTYLSAEGQMHEGYWSTHLGLTGIPGAAEDVIVARDILLAELTGARVHIAHVSTARSVQLIREAQKRGVRVSAEVTPHHLVLTDAALASFDTRTKVNPPLRTEEDREALLAGLADGTIAVIATDHAPHTFEDKDCEFNYAACGISGLETALPLVWNELIQKRILEIPQLIACLTVNPARILGLPKGTLEIGQDADISIIDPQMEKAICLAEFSSLGKNSPFDGWQAIGWPVATLVKGQLIMENGQILI